LADQAIPVNAQEPVRVRTVGVLMGIANDAEAKARVDAFEQSLEREGWSVGHNLRTEYRYAEGDSARMQALAKELVELKPDCVLGHSTPVTAALIQATRTTPIVFVAVSDPIGSGFVASMARPTGNVTGFTVLRASIAGKYLEMLKEMAPQLARVAIMYNPNSVPVDGTFFFTSVYRVRDKVEGAAHHRGSARSVRDRKCHHETRQRIWKRPRSRAG
jgi:putative ABC transport system substrate-binding protein